MLSRLASSAPTRAALPKAIYSKAFPLSRRQFPQLLATGRTSWSASSRAIRQLASKAHSSVTSGGVCRMSTSLAALHGRVAARVGVLARRMSSGGGGGGDGSAGMSKGGRYAVASIVAMNVLVYMMWQSGNPRFMMRHFMLCMDHFQWHTLITYAFSHQDSWHLAVNMGGLLCFAAPMVAALGAPAFLGAYASMGVLSGLTFTQREGATPPLTMRFNDGSSYLMMRDRSLRALGASGAVYGVAAYSLCAAPFARVPFLPVPLWLLAAGVVAYNAYFFAVHTMKLGAFPDPIFQTAHLSGAVTGGLLFLATRGRVRRA